MLLLWDGSGIVDRENCDRCIKSARLKVNSRRIGSEYTQSCCKIFDEIGEQWMGYGNEPVSIRTYDAAQRMDCPYRREHYAKHKKKDIDKSLTFNFE